MAKKKTKARETVAIVGTGNVGSAMAVALNRSGVRVTEIITRDEAASRKKGSALARKVKARATTLSTATIDAKVVWLCVSDGAIAEVAEQLAKLPVKWKGKSVLHASGALTAAELQPLKDAGAATASFHPMNTFLVGMSADLRGTPFGAEGDDAAIRAAARITRKLSGNAPVFRIKPEDKVLYHAIGGFVSPLNVSALNISERIAQTIGVNRPQALVRMILLRTVNNFLANGSAGAFSGPIRRGDVNTIRKHLAALKRIPGARETYIALAMNALEHLPAKNQAEIRALLEEE